MTRPHLLLLSLARVTDPPPLLCPVITLRCALSPVPVPVPVAVLCSDDVNIVAVLKAMGAESDQEVVQLVGPDEQLAALLMPSIQVCAGGNALRGSGLHMPCSLLCMCTVCKRASRVVQADVLLD